MRAGRACHPPLCLLHHPHIAAKIPTWKAPNTARMRHASVSQALGQAAHTPAGPADAAHFQNWTGEASNFIRAMQLGDEGGEREGWMEDGLLCRPDAAARPALPRRRRPI